MTFTNVSPFSCYAKGFACFLQFTQNFRAVLSKMNDIHFAHTVVYGARSIPFFFENGLVAVPAAASCFAMFGVSVLFSPHQSLYLCLRKTFRSISNERSLTPLTLTSLFI